LRLAVGSLANADGFFDLGAAGRGKREHKEKVLSLEERKRAMEWLAQAQEDCPMYSLILQQRQIRPKHFSAEMLRRIPYDGRGCAAGMPMGYMMVKPNGEVNPCMLLQIDLCNIREQSLVSIWEGSAVLAQLRKRELLKGECGGCSYRGTCFGCRGRAYEETGDTIASEPGF